MKATYHVYYKTDDMEEMLTIKASSAGEAFADCLHKHPERKLIKAVREGKFNDGFGKTEFLPPPKYQ